MQTFALFSKILVALASEDQPAMFTKCSISGWYFSFMAGSFIYAELSTNKDYTL